jgi:hypothetical protein
VRARHSSNELDPKIPQATIRMLTRVAGLGLRGGLPEVDRATRGLVTVHPMRSVPALRRGCGAFWQLLFGAAAFACSEAGPGSEPQNGSPSGAGGRGGNGVAGALSASGAGGLVSAAGGAAPAGGGAVAAGSPSHAGTGGLAGVGTGGMLAGGSHSGGASAAGHAGGGSGGSGGGGGGAAGTNAVCQTVKAEYAAELDKQLDCKPNVAAQCTNKVAAAPGCACRVFMQPTDPFAIEHLANLDNGWFEADCSMPSCPAKCSTATAGTCQADAKSPLGGRCVTP